MINTTQTSRFITRDNVKYAHTKGVSQNCRSAGFIPAFRDSVTGEVCLSRFEDGSTAPVHMLDGMPDHWVTERDEDNHVVRIKGSIIAGFIRDGKYYSREEMAALITQLGDAPRKGALSGRQRKGAIELTLVSKAETDPKISIKGNCKRNWGQIPNVKGFILIGILMAFNSTIGYAERFLFVNGQRLNNQQISYLEQIHCGPIPNGSYWLNINSGLWGYAGNPTPQGYITDNCNRSQQRPSLSERGLLYSPGELLR